MDDEDDKRDNEMHNDNMTMITSNGLCTHVPLNNLKTPFKICCLKREENPISMPDALKKTVNDLLAHCP